MKTGMYTVGLEDVTDALQRRLKARGQELTYKGLVRAGLLICRDAVKMAPIDTSNLRQSAYVIGKQSNGNVQKRQGAKGHIARGVNEVAHVQAEYMSEAADLFSSRYDIAVQVGFTASYAAAVHEGDPTFNWNKGGPQFLQKSVQMHITDVEKLATEEVSKI